MSLCPQYWRETAPRFRSRGSVSAFKKFWGEKNKSAILSRGHQLTRNPDVKFLCLSSSFCAGLASSATGSSARIREAVGSRQLGGRSGFLRPREG